MARYEDDFDPQQLDRDALMEQLGGVKAPSDLPPVDAPTSNTMPSSPPVTPAPVTPAGPSRTPYTGFQAKHDYSAFDTAREQNPEKSAKDAFAMLSNQAPPPPFNDKAALGQWFAQYIQPGMDQLGHKVSSVDGDKFSYGNHEGNFNVDMAQNAGAEAGTMQQRLQWGAESADDATRQRYAPGGSGGGPFTPQTAQATQAAPQSINQMDRETDPMQAILAEIDALQNGGPSQMDSEALMALLQQGQQV